MFCIRDQIGSVAYKVSAWLLFYHSISWQILEDSWLPTHCSLELPLLEIIHGINVTPKLLKPSWFDSWAKLPASIWSSGPQGCLSSGNPWLHLLFKERFILQSMIQVQTNDAGGERDWQGNSRMNYKDFHNLILLGNTGVTITQSRDRSWDLTEIKEKYWMSQRWCKGSPYLHRLGFWALFWAWDNSATAHLRPSYSAQGHSENSLVPVTQFIY